MVNLVSLKTTSLSHLRLRVKPCTQAVTDQEMCAQSKKEDGSVELDMPTCVLLRAIDRKI